MAASASTFDPSLISMTTTGSTTEYKAYSTATSTTGTIGWYNQQPYTTTEPYIVPQGGGLTNDLIETSRLVQIQLDNLRMSNELKDMVQTIHGLQELLKAALSLEDKDLSSLNIAETVRKVQGMRKHIGSEGVKEA
jgi:hypothetical protein